ncbi:MAG TPA: Gfo/Idh/MocA family oxidoreductase [Terriglobales bacterium]|jgi:predicted dehydrogenase
MDLRIGLIGCGEHSEIGHAVPLAHYAAANPGKISLAAACDLRPERAELFRSKYGFSRAYVDMREMIENERLDLCIAVTPVEKISEVGVMLLNRKLPCVVEKPLGTTLDQASQLLDTATATGTLNMVSVNRRFMPLLRYGLEWARKTGQIRYVRSTMLRHARNEPQFLRETAIHSIDTLRFIAGEVHEFDVQNLKNAAPEWFSIDLQFVSGIRGRLDVLPTAGVVEETYELFGDGFRVVITSPFGPQRVVRCFQQDRIVHEEVVEPGAREDVVNGFYGEVVELVDSLSQGRRPHPSIAEVFPSVKLCFEIADRSEAAGRAANI